MYELRRSGDAGNWSSVDWTAAAGLVQHMQYQAMFEGFAQFAWEFYAAQVSTLES